MAMVRTAMQEDRAAIQSLWSVCFQDSEEFTNWFFQQRYVPEYSACVEENGRLVSAMQSLPLFVRVRDRLLPSAIVAGVSTDPACRGKGYMGDMFRYYMNRMRQEGIVAVPHTPANLPTFFSKGHYPVTDTAHLTVAQGAKALLTDRKPNCCHAEDRSLTDCFPDYGGMLSCYDKFARHYSGIAARSLADFRLKMADYDGEPGTRCLLLWDSQEKAKIQGYVIYQQTKDHLHAEEVITPVAALQDELLFSLLVSAGNKSCHVKLPPDRAVSSELFRSGSDYTWEIRPQGVMGAANIPAFLSLLSDGSKSEDITLSVTDPIVPENNGNFTLSGAPSCQKPQVSLDAGRLVQLLCGYQSAAELAEEEKIIAADPAVLRELDQIYPKLSCFIIDEY